MEANIRKIRMNSRLIGIHQRVQWMADEDVRFTLINGWAAREIYMESKERLIDEAELVLDALEGKGANT